MRGSDGSSTDLCALGCASAGVGGVFHPNHPPRCPPGSRGGRPLKNGPGHRTHSEHSLQQGKSVLRPSTLRPIRVIAPQSACDVHRELCYTYKTCMRFKAADTLPSLADVMLQRQVDDAGVGREVSFRRGSQWTGEGRGAVTLRFIPHRGLCRGLTDCLALGTDVFPGSGLEPGSSRSSVRCMTL